MRRAPLVLTLLGAVARALWATAPEDLVGTDPFALLTEDGGLAVSLERSRTSAGTRVILTDYRKGRRFDQSLTLRGTGDPGWSYLAVRGTTGVIELEDRGGERVLVLEESAGRDTQKWRIEPVAPGRYRVASKTGLALSTARAGPAAPAAGGTEERWRLMLQPLALDRAPGGDREPGPGGAFATLDRQIESNRESWLDTARIRTALADYLSSGGDPEMDKGMRLLLQERIYTLAPDERNWAFTLFLWLLAQGAWEPGDTITVALALANASLYADGDTEVRQRIRADVVEHYLLYRDIASWQQGWVIRYRLPELPILAKVLWAYRANQLEQDGETLTLEEYETFVDRIDVIREMHDLVHSADVEEAPTLRALMQNLDRIFQSHYKYAHFMSMIRQWYTPDAPLPAEATDDQLYEWLTRPEVAALLPDWVAEVLEDYRSGRYYVEVLGRRRDPQARMWVNYQWRLYGETGYFRGDCGTEAEVSMALWKAAGVAAMAVYHTGKDIGHAYPMYYDPFVRRYTALQDLGYMRDKFGGGAAVTMHPMPLRIHDHLPFLDPRPSSTVDPYTRFVARGMDYGVWEALFLDREPAPGDTVFTPERGPTDLADLDRDGLRDEDEAAHGTSAGTADTDRDGFGDGWEVERGFDPLQSASPSRAELGKVLVGHVVRIVSAQTGLPLEASGGADGRSRYRIVRSDEAQFHYLVSAATGLALTSNGRGGLAEAPLTGAKGQKWRLLHREAGSFVVQSRADATVIAWTAERGLVTRGPRATADERWVIR